MKKKISYLMLILSGMLASCNLFIEDEFEDLSNGLDLNKKTVYTGEGWSEPTTETGEGYTITYQYHDNVKLLTDEIQSYITHWEVDEFSGSIGIIDFRENTPERFLPRIGEIITSRSTVLMPDGFYAEVMAAGFEEGVYRIATCAVEMDKVFQKLEGEIDWTLDDDELPTSVRQGNVAATRANDGSEGQLKLLEAVEESVDDGDGGSACYLYTYPVEAMITGKMPKINNSKKRGAIVDNKGNVSKWSKSTFDEDGRVKSTNGESGVLELRPSETTMTHRLKLKIGLEGLIPTITITDTIATKGIARISGGIDCNKSVEKSQKLKSKALKAGPVSIKILISFGVGVSANLFGSANVHFNDSSVVATKVRLFPPFAQDFVQFLNEKASDLDAWVKGQSITKEEKGNRHIKGSMHVTEGSIEGDFNFFAILSFGASFGTSKVSNGFFLKNTMKGDGSSFGLTGKDYLDIADMPGLSVTSKTEVGVKLCVSVIGLLEGIVGGVIDKAQLGTGLYLFIVEKGKELGIYKDDAGSTIESLDELLESADEYLNKADEITAGTVANYDFPPVTVDAWRKNLGNTSWMPDMKGFSYKLTATTDEGVSYETTWTYKDKGMLVDHGFGPYYPCIYVDGGKNDPATGTYYPELAGYDETDPIGKNTNLKNYGISITISKLQPGKDYTVYPALSLGRGRKPLFCDVGQTISVAATTVKIASVEQTGCYLINDKNGILKYNHSFVVNVAVKGAARVYEWAIYAQFPTSTGKFVDYEKRVRKPDVKETRAHPVNIFVESYLYSFETMVGGEYYVIQSTADSQEGLSTSYHLMDSYPLVASWETISSSRAADRKVQHGKSPFDAARAEKIDKFIKAYGDDIPVVFFDDDIEPATPVAITEGGIRKPLPPLK